MACIARVAQGVVDRFDVGQYTSDHSLLILALMAVKNGAKAAHQTQEKRLSGTIARDGGRAG
jgi:hypothetical protein